MSLQKRAQKCLWCVSRAIGIETELMKQLRGTRFKMMSASVRSSDGHISRTHRLTTKTSALCSTATMSALTNKATTLKHARHVCRYLLQLGGALSKKTGQAMNILHNNGACSCNHCGRITHYEWVSVALAIQHAMSKAHIVNVWPAPPYNIFQHSLINGMIFERKKKKITEHKMCVVIVSTTFVRKISHSKKNWERYEKKWPFVFVQSTRHSSQILMNLKFSRQIFYKYSNIIFHENPSSGSRAVPCGLTGMTKLPIAFRNFGNAPANWDPYVLTSPRWLGRCRLVPPWWCGVKTDTRQIRRTQSSTEANFSPTTSLRSFNLTNITAT